MAKAGVIGVLALASCVVMFWAPTVFQAFVPTTGRSGPVLNDRFLGISGAPAGGPASATFGVATVAVSMVAALAAGRLLAAHGQRRAAAPVVARQAWIPGQTKGWSQAKIDQEEAYEKMYAEQDRAEEFAGGLIGGESAFSSGDYNFDPLSLAERFPLGLPLFREAELKHGRICMLAWVGLVVPEIVRIPGPERCYGATNVVEAHNRCVGTDADPTSPLLQVFIFCGIIEFCTTWPKMKQFITLENAGDYQLGLNFLPKDELKAKEMKLKELKNGRLAMVAFSGAITQAVLTGNGFPWLY